MQNFDASENNQISGSRFTFAMLSWLFSSVGIVFSVVFFFVGLTKEIEDSLTVLMAFLPLVAWISLWVMTAFWLKNRKCHSILLLIGTLSGVFSAIVFYEMFVVYISAIPLAVYLVFWHLTRRSSGTGLQPAP